jgi:hypothetical protein
MDQLPSLPIGRQYFASVRKPNTIYVDKTEYIFRLCSDDGYYFLSRPRRFGKSLTLDTIHELFNGNRELFKGLWIEDKWDWSTTYPVLHISFARLAYKEVGLEEAIRHELGNLAKPLGLIYSKNSIAIQFEELIKCLHQKHGGVVVLIDEYDKPIYCQKQSKSAKNLLFCTERCRAISAIFVHHGRF